jgi:DNA-binding response OmpR family regulator
MRAPESFHIMVTDINHHVRNFLKRELEKEGYAVTSVKSGGMAYESIYGGTALDLIILDPEIFLCFDQTHIEEIVRRHTSLQIIIHTYADNAGNIKVASNIHIVEKGGQSIAALKSVIRGCFELFQGNRKF